MRVLLFTVTMSFAHLINGFWGFHSCCIVPVITLRLLLIVVVIRSVTFDSHSFVFTVCHQRREFGFGLTCGPVTSVLLPFLIRLLSLVLQPRWAGAKFPGSRGAPPCARPTI